MKNRKNIETNLRPITPPFLGEKIKNRFKNYLWKKVEETYPDYKYNSLGSPEMFYDDELHLWACQWDGENSSYARYHWSGKDFVCYENLPPSMKRPERIMG